MQTISFVLYVFDIFFIFYKYLIIATKKKRTEKLGDLFSNKKKTHAKIRQSKITKLNVLLHLNEFE